MKSDFTYLKKSDNSSRYYFKRDTHIDDATKTTWLIDQPFLYNSEHIYAVNPKDVVKDARNHPVMKT